MTVWQLACNPAFTGSMQPIIIFLLTTCNPLFLLTVWHPANLVLLHDSIMLSCHVNLVLLHHILIVVTVLRSIIMFLPYYGLFNPMIQKSVQENIQEFIAN